MSASPFPSSRDAASHALGALERYRVRVRRLAANWRDLDLYRAVGDDLEQVRAGCVAVPALSAGWVGLLIAHAELIQCLWESSVRPRTAASERERLLQKVESQAGVLELACMKLVGAA